MNDCKIANDNLPIRQGDIFVYLNWPKRSPWDQLGVILTADCDIAQNKSGAYLAYLPLTSLPNYVNQRVTPHSIEKQIKSAISEIEKLYIKGRKSIDPSAQPPTRMALEAWILDGHLNDLQGQLILSDKEETRLSDLKTVVREVRLDSNLDPHNRREQLRRLYGKLKNKNGEEQSAFERNEIKNHLTNPPNDIFFISFIPGLTQEFRPNLGYYALLRELRPIEINDISTRITTASHSENAAVRVARLEATYKYALSQKFAYLFSRIGLPEDFENDQREIIDIIFEELTK